jgi:hypothetical protein
MEWVAAAHEGISSAYFMMLIFLDARIALMSAGRSPEKQDYNPEFEIRSEINDHIREALQLFKKKKVSSVRVRV